MAAPQPMNLSKSTLGFHTNEWASAHARLSPEPREALVKNAADELVYSFPRDSTWLRCLYNVNCSTAHQLIEFSHRASLVCLSICFIFISSCEQPQHQNDLPSLAGFNCGLQRHSYPVKWRVQTQRQWNAGIIVPQNGSRLYDRLYERDAKLFKGWYSYQIIRLVVQARWDFYRD